ncbi:MAG: GNAT family N-acetyltransferase [Firmicutes bacterium]|nr:GNAT family N-acetyltransferase [Bacillota bacterium]
MERFCDSLRISTDKSLLSIESIRGFLNKSYWASGRPVEKIKMSIDNSICFGVYYKEKQVGFARVVTDYASMYWVADVFIDEGYRGRGLGKRLIGYIVEQEELKGLKGILGTRDAHGLYEQYGFIKDRERFMLRQPSGV